jgi:hypothetical protein
VTAIARVVAAALLVATAACSSSQPAPPAACPRVAVLDELAELVRFRSGAGRDLTDIELQARFSGFAFGCRYDRTAVTVEIDLSIEATRGPATPASKASFQYFAAVTNPAGEIVAKEIFDAEVEFKGNATRLVVADELAQRIPLIDRTTGPNWSVLLGLQLTEDQRDWVRQRRVR